MPNLEVFEKDHRFVARFELPGIKKEEINIEVAEGQLVVSGERKREEEEEKEGFYRSEYEYGSFYRSIPLPEGAKTENVTAMLKNGVLEVTVPLAALPEPKARKVEIAEPTKAAA
jgi:HSP20 family protein